MDELCDKLLEIIKLTSKNESTKVEIKLKKEIINLQETMITMMRELVKLKKKVYNDDYEVEKPPSTH
jgi:hypothetical protein